MARRRKDLEDTLTSDAVSPDTAGRLERFGVAIGRIRGGRRMDIDRAQLIGGGALAVLGLIAILVGWYGSAHTGFAFEQTPYLISGGLLGVALVFLGGFVYFAYWVTRLVRESRTQNDRLAELLDQIAFSLNGHGAAVAATARRGAARPIAGGSSETFVATKSGTFFHRPDCAVVEGRPGLRKVTAATKGLEPCGICNPLELDT